MIAVRTVGPIGACPGQAAAGRGGEVHRPPPTHRFQLIGLMAILALGSGASGHAGSRIPTFLVAVGACMVLLCILSRYVLTTEGVNTHASLVKSWKTFRHLPNRRSPPRPQRATGWSRAGVAHMSDKSRKEVERVLRGRGLRPDGESAQTLTPKKALARR